MKLGPSVTGLQVYCVFTKFLKGKWVIESSQSVVIALVKPRHQSHRSVRDAIKGAVIEKGLCGGRQSVQLVTWFQASHLKSNTPMSSFCLRTENWIWIDDLLKSSINIYGHTDFSGGQASIPLKIFQSFLVFQQNASEVKVLVLQKERVLTDI